MKVLVTGHKGYIGTVLSSMLKHLGHDVFGIDSDLYRHCTFGPAPEPIPELIKDVRDIELEDVRHFDAIIHLAALSNDVLGNLNPQLTMEINYKASLNLARLAKEARVPRFLFASSCSMYGASGDSILDESAQFSPVTAYAESKVFVERDVSRLADRTFSPTFLRNATAYGASPRIRFDVVINNLIAWAYTTGSIFLKSDGTPWRPVVHVEDISRAFVAIMSSPLEKVHNQAFNIGLSSHNYRISELADIVEKTVPNCTITYAAGAEPDKRCYRVSCDKYSATFPDHPLSWDPSLGAKQLYNSYIENNLQRDEYEGVRYKRIAHIRHLLETGQLDDTLRWRMP